MGDIRYRWNNYKSSPREFDRKDSCMQEHLYRHFSTPGHTELDPMKREDYWIKTLKSIASYVVNIEDSV